MKNLKGAFALHTTKHSYQAIINKKKFFLANPEYATVIALILICSYFNFSQNHNTVFRSILYIYSYFSVIVETRKNADINTDTTKILNQLLADDAWLEQVLRWIDRHARSIVCL